MTTHTRTAAIDAAPDDHQTSLSSRLWQRLAAFVAERRAQAENRRVRAALAEMPDNLLLDIGIAEDEIHRVRAREAFTPRYWTDHRGASRRVPC